MSSRSAAIHLPIVASSPEVRVALLTWIVYFSCMCAYCLVHQAVVQEITPDLLRTAAIALREWGAWLITGPILFTTLSRHPGDLRKPQVYLRLASVLVPASLLVPLLVDSLTRTRAPASTIAIFLPRYAAAFVVLCLIWHVFLRKADSAEQRAERPATAAATEAPQTLLVSRGADECLIQIDTVQYVSAAGNYVEICADGQLYLMRATMKRLEALLPPSQFVRIHRSHIVRVQEIERIRIHRSGHGAVHLRCGKVLPMSKRYKAQLRHERTAARSPQPLNPA
ncbi:MAG: LytTR family DNA-binding domain-containing protein [Gammaproteobacteria bacterium]|nr:hypothetical protein [Gammaproteobacteria bacterium]